MDEATVIIDEKLFQERMGDLEAAFIGAGRESDAATIVEDEARLFLKMAIGLTPPKNKQQGEKAVARDIKKLFTPVEPGFLNFVSSHFGNHDVQAWLTDNSMEPYQIDWTTVDMHGYGMTAFHQRNRDRRGRTGIRNFNKGLINDRWKATYVVAVDTLANYIKEVQKRVGRMKAGWFRAYYAAGGKSPSWIQRHAATAPGDVINELNVKGHPRIVMKNHAPGITYFSRVFREAARIRMEAMKRRARLVISGYNQDIARGMKISRKAKRTPDF